MLGTARTLRAHLVTLPSQASVAQRGYRPSDDAQEADCRRFTGQLSILHSATSSQFSNDSWQQQSTGHQCMLMHCISRHSTHPPTGYQGRYREWCAATQSSARAGGRPRVARECNSSGPRALPPGAQPRLSQCGSRGLCAFNPYVSLNTTIAIYVGSTHAKSLSGREAEQPRGAETTLSSDGQFCIVNTCVCGTRRRRYRVRQA